MDRRGFLGRLVRAVIAAPVLAFAGPAVAVVHRPRKVDFGAWRNYSFTYTPCAKAAMIENYRVLLRQHGVDHGRVEG